MADEDRDLRKLVSVYQFRFLKKLHQVELKFPFTPLFQRGKYFPSFDKACLLQAGEVPSSRAASLTANKALGLWRRTAGRDYCFFKVLNCYRKGRKE
jgi:hypothetical protein